MPKQIDLNEIAKTNPNIDLKKLEEWKKLRGELLRTGSKKSSRQGFPFQGRRARIVDDGKFARLVRHSR